MDHVTEENECNLQVVGTAKKSCFTLPEVPLFCKVEEFHAPRHYAKDPQTDLSYLPGREELLEEIAECQQPMSADVGG